MLYLDLVILLNFMVDLLLLFAANRLSGHPAETLRTVASAAIGSIYAGACMLDDFRFLGNFLWRAVCLCIMCVIAFGWNRSAFRRGVLFVFLSMALGGIAIGFGKGGFLELVLSAGLVLSMCVLGFRGKVGPKAFVPVELCRDGKLLRLTALQDTGNTLTDPLTGESVLVAGPDIAREVFGLTPAQLADPILTMEHGGACGFRLIPYRAIGQPCGLLLAVKFDTVKVNGVHTGRLVAFSPNGFGRGSAYQALTGGF